MWTLLQVEIGPLAKLRGWTRRHIETEAERFATLLGGSLTLTVAEPER